MSFRESFTKSKEQLLEYDDSASLYFGGTTILCIFIPFFIHVVSTTLSTLSGTKIIPSKSPSGHQFRYCKCQSCLKKYERLRLEGRAYLKSGTFIIKCCLLLMLGLALVQITKALATVSEIAAFNPFDILGIHIGANDKNIRKAYRTLSLKHHPDKNPNDPSSAARFMLVAKAYQALTDEVARANYEKYGNPDGPGAMKVGIGLPHFLVDEQNQGLILAFSLICLIFLVPFLFILYYHKTKLFYPNGVRVETIHFLSLYLNENVRRKNGAEFLAAAAESRDQVFTEADLIELSALVPKIRDYKKTKFTSPITKRNYILLLAHMQRMHDDIPKRLLTDLNSLLRVSPAITQSMIEIAFIHNWLTSVRSLVEFRRSIIQALDSQSSTLLQIPHFTEAMVKHCSRGTKAVTTLREFIDQDVQDRKGLLDLTIEQLTDIEEFCNQLPRVKLEINAQVFGEKEIVEGDVVTVSVRLTRMHLKKGEAAGPVHAPFFPGLKYEEWWLFLIDTQTGSLQTYCRSKNLEKVVIEELKFVAPRPAELKLAVIAMCDVYAGLDVLEGLPLNVLSRTKVKREIIVHPDDMELDNEPTLLQQMMGEFNNDDQTDDEDETS